MNHLTTSSSKQFSRFPAELLYSFYKLSFKNILNIDLPTGVQLLQDFPDFLTYMRGVWPEDEQARINKALTEYQQIVSPRAKLDPLLSFLRHNTSRFRNLLDYGCGGGHMMNYLIQNSPSLEVVWGIDSDKSVFRTYHQARLDKVFFGTDLIELRLPEKTVDLVIITHTLHHIASHKHGKILAELASIMNPKGLLYLYEDSWDTRIEAVDEKAPTLDAVFASFTGEQKRELFLLNDFWANNWFFGRSLSTDISWYHPLERWQTILVESGLNPVDSGTVGFDNKRLHGVPAAWIIAARQDSLDF